MALKATVYKAQIAVANLNLHHYSDYSLTLAKHPSETDLRFLIRVLTFGLLSQEDLQFTKGLSTDAEPDMWKINHDGSIEHWVELGLPDERRIRQICGKAHNVSIFTYHGKQAEQWFETIARKLDRFDHLSIIHFNFEDPQILEKFVNKGMKLSLTIEDNEIWLATESDRTCIHFKTVKT
jgi:uncharacterized protein YaeQ